MATKPLMQEQQPEPIPQQKRKVLPLRGGALQAMEQYIQQLCVFPDDPGLSPEEVLNPSWWFINADRLRARDLIWVHPTHSRWSMLVMVAQVAVDHIVVAKVSYVDLRAALTPAAAIELPNVEIYDSGNPRQGYICKRKSTGEILADGFPSYVEAVRFIQQHACFR